MKYSLSDLLIAPSAGPFKVRMIDTNRALNAKTTDGGTTEFNVEPAPDYDKPVRYSYRIRINSSGVKVGDERYGVKNLTPIKAGTIEYNILRVLGRRATKYLIARGDYFIIESEQKDTLVEQVKTIVKSGSLPLRPKFKSFAEIQGLPRIIILIAQEHHERRAIPELKVKLQKVRYCNCESRRDPDKCGCPVRETAISIRIPGSKLKPVDICIKYNRNASYQRGYAKVVINGEQLQRWGQPGHMKISVAIRAFAEEIRNHLGYGEPNEIDKEYNYTYEPAETYIREPRYRH